MICRSMLLTLAAVDCLMLAGCPSPPAAAVREPIDDRTDEALRDATPDDTLEPEIFNQDGPGCPDAEDH